MCLGKTYFILPFGGQMQVEKMCVSCNKSIIYAKTLCKKCYTRAWHVNNRESELEKYSQRYLDNKQIEQIKRKTWYAENGKLYYRNYYIKTDGALKQRQRYANNLGHKIKACIRARVNTAIKSKSDSCTDLLGTDIATLILHLESGFLPGMSWKNHSRKGWHIDHIIPLASFDLTDPEQLKKACHYTNLQPLWAKDNLSKGSNILGDAHG